MTDTHPAPAVLYVTQIHLTNGVSPREPRARLRHSGHVTTTERRVVPTPLPWRSSVARHDAWKAWEQDNTVTSRTLMGARQMEQGSAGALGLGVAGARFFAGFCGHIEDLLLRC